MQATGGEKAGTAEEKVSNKFVDIAYATATHVEGSLAAGDQTTVRLHALDKDMFGAGSLSNSAETLREIQVCRGLFM